MEAEDAFSMDMMGPSAEDRANGAALPGTLSTAGGFAILTPPPLRRKH